MSDPSEHGGRRLTKGIWSARPSPAAGVALIASATALTFQLWPSLAPDPGTIQAASMAVETVDRHVSLYRDLEQYYPAQLKSLSPGDRTQARHVFGSVAYLRIKIYGRKHANVTLNYVSYNWDTKLEVPGTPGVPEGFEPNNPTDEWIAPVFILDPVPPPSEGLPPARFFVRLRLFDGNVLLAFADTPRLAAAR